VVKSFPHQIQMLYVFSDMSENFWCDALRISWTWLWSIVLSYGVLNVHVCMWLCACE